MNDWKCDVAVLLIFFTRYKQFEQTFEQVKKARPRVLLLWQDGPRDDHPNDMDAILRCRKIVEDGVDWDCTIYKNYHTSNIGCDPSTFMSHKWAFSIVEKCIILEDDVKVSESFFPFCKELLDKYEYDERINRICGMNTIGVLNDCPYDYFFSEVGSVWGWATWKRVADGWDESYNFLDDRYDMELIYLNHKSHYYKEYLRRTVFHRSTGIPYWETIHSYNIYLNSRLNIVPTKNMVCNTGLDVDSTHAMADIKLIPRAKRKLYYMDTYEISFPLKHPLYIVNNIKYIKMNERLMGINHPLIKFSRRIESLLLKVRYGQFKNLSQSIINRIKRKRLN